MRAADSTQGPGWYWLDQMNRSTEADRACVTGGAHFLAYFFIIIIIIIIIITTVIIIIPCRKGSIVCNFKINYVLKEGYVAVPFTIKASNVTTALNKGFSFENGILFQRFIIAKGSYRGASNYYTLGNNKSIKNTS